MKQDRKTQAGPASAPDPTQWLLLAHILRPQGRKGEVLADLFTDVPSRFQANPRVYLAKPDFTGTLDQARETMVLDFFLPVGKNSGRIVLQLEGIDSISAAETLAGLDLLIPHEDRLEPDQDASYVSDLIGCAVYDGTTLAGTIEDVHFPSTPDGSRRLDEAAPLLVLLSPTGAELLIPFVKDYLVAIGLEARRIDMALPPGLLDINA